MNVERILIVQEFSCAYKIMATGTNRNYSEDSGPENILEAEVYSFTRDYEESRSRRGNVLERIMRIREA